MRGHKFFTSESVSGGHPDKVADQISDAVLDACLQAAGADGSAEDPRVRVACETLVRENTVVLAGEFRLPQGMERPNFEQAARQAVRNAGYCDGAVENFDADTFSLCNFLCKQSDEIFGGTTPESAQNKKIGAGDQGMMFGYAVNEVDEAAEFMPMPIHASHSILRLHDECRRSGRIPWLKPDAKSQVTVEYDGTRPVSIRRAIFSTQHAADVALEQVHSEGEALVREALGKLGIPLAENLRIDINSAGAWTQGGPAVDGGLTGRKLMVDTYGAMGRHGGGAFSGKDPTKVDRSAAYACRYAAKNVVAAGLTTECEVQVSYSIGQNDKPEISVNGFDRGPLSNERLTELVSEHFDFSVQGILENLHLWQPFYRRFGVLGHFGQPDAPWEALDRVEDLKQAGGQ